MTSINTNIAAQTALRTLQSTNAQLDATQGRISTGLKIGEAKDNAAYWSISTTLRSDNKALGTVKDALGLGSATVDVAYQALNETLSVLDEIKSKLTAATQENVDKKAVQSEVNELKKQLEAIAKSATFSGENWLSVDSEPADYTSEKSVVSAFNRNGGVVSLDTIDIDISAFVLIDEDADVAGLLEGTENASPPAGELATAIGASAAAGTTAAPYVIAFGNATRTLSKGDLISFDVAVNGGTARTVNIDFKLVNDTLKVTDGRIETAAQFDDVLKAAFEAAGVTVATEVDGNNVEVVGAGSGIVVSAETAVGRDGVLDIDIDGLDRPAIEQLIRTVNIAADAVTAGAAQLGAVAARIELQQSFVSNLMDTIDKGVSGLVDADMNEESTRLQALQVKQQLGVQALSIANQSAQNVLRLFQ